jgi:hypothetical protein
MTAGTSADSIGLMNAVMRSASEGSAVALRFVLSELGVIRELRSPVLRRPLIALDQTTYKYRVRGEMMLEWGSPGSDRQLVVSQPCATSDLIWTNADEEVGVPVEEMQFPNTEVPRWPGASVAKWLDQHGEAFTSPRVPEIGSGEI